MKRLHDRNLIKETVNAYCGESKGQDRAEKLESWAKDLGNKLDKGVIAPNQVHLGQLFESMVNYPGSRIHNKVGEMAASADRADLSDTDISSAITASEFPFITGKLIHDTLIPSYEENLTGIDMLMTEDDTDRKVVDVAGTMGSEEPERLLEGEEYELTTDREKTIQIQTHKFGRRIPVTRELIQFDKTGGSILRKARNAGPQMARHRLTWAIQGIQDLAITATGQAVNTIFKYDGSTAALYSSDHSAIDGQTNVNSIADTLTTLGLQASRKQLRKQTDFYGKKLRLDGEVLLVPEALYVESSNFTVSITDPNQQKPGVAILFGGITVIGDPLLDDTSTTAWFYGNFKRQFLWMWIWRPGVEPIPGDPRRDIVMEFKYGYYAGFGAQDYRYVIKSTGA